MSQGSQTTGATWITLAEAKDQLAIDPSLTIHDVRLQRLIGAAIDWAENFTQRSLSELIDLNSPSDSSAVAGPDPVDSPTYTAAMTQLLDADPSVDYTLWTPDQWQSYWAVNPIQMDQSKPLRRDVKEALLLKVEILFDRNPETMVMYEAAAESALWPYRIALGV